MAKINLSGFKKEVEAALKELQKPARMKTYGEFASRMIKVRTRLGYGVSSRGGEREKLAELKDSTVISRGGKIGTNKNGKRTVRRNKSSSVKLSPETTPAKSNLTRTGELLEAIKPTFSGQGVVVIGPDGTRRDRSGLTNAAVAYFVTEGGRPFLNLTKAEIRQLSENVRRDLKEILERVLTKRGV